jgi:hypothetical protein
MRCLDLVLHVWVYCCNEDTFRVSWLRFCIHPFWIGTWIIGWFSFALNFCSWSLLILILDLEIFYTLNWALIDFKHLLTPSSWCYHILTKFLLLGNNFLRSKILLFSLDGRLSPIHCSPLTSNVILLSLRLLRFFGFLLFNLLDRLVHDFRNLSFKGGFLDNTGSKILLIVWFKQSLSVLMKLICLWSLSHFLEKFSFRVVLNHQRGFSFLFLCWLNLALSKRSCSRVN